MSDETYVEVVRKIARPYRPDLYNIVDEVYQHLVGDADRTDAECSILYNVAKDMVGDYLLNHAGSDWHRGLALL